MKFLFILLLAASQVWGEEPVQPHIKVQGRCEQDVVPDRGMISFTSEHQARNQETAVKKTNEQINKLKKSIEALKLSDLELKNTNYSVYPVREWEKERMVEKGFRAALTLQLSTSDIARIGEAMIKASEAGITNVGQLYTVLSLKKAQEEYLKCLDIAAEDARMKARQLAKKLNFKIGDVIALDETPQVEHREPPMPMAMMKSMSADESAPTKIEAGTQKFATTIQVTFEIK